MNWCVVFNTTVEWNVGKETFQSNQISWSI